MTSGAACLRTSSGGWLLVRASAPGTVDLEAGLNDDMLRSDATCRR